MFLTLTTALTVVSDTVHIIQGQISFSLKVVIIGTPNIRKNQLNYILFPTILIYPNTIKPLMKPTALALMGGKILFLASLARKRYKRIAGLATKNYNTSQNKISIKTSIKNSFGQKNWDE